MMDLAGLRSTYDAERARLDANHPPITAVDHCRYCGKRWLRWHGSRLDGHVRCVVSQEFLHHVVEVLDGDARATYVSVAAALGVTPSVVRAWRNSVKRNPRQ